MTPEGFDFELVSRLFLQAVELESGEREAWVHELSLPDGEREVLLDLIERDKHVDEGTAVLDSRELDARLEQALRATLIGARIGDFVIERFLGSGGMGLVYAARQGHPSREVALKILRENQDERGRQRFEHEIEILAHLTHPNIARVYSAGTYELPLGGSRRRLPYYALELLPEAKTITDFVRERKLDTSERIALFRQVCAAVHFAHQRGIIHRDLKPDNILVSCEGVPKVIDFGVARSSELTPLVSTVEGGIIGTIAYLSPEQILEPHSIDVRSDLYALGVVLYQLLTGESPYRHPGSLHGLLQAITSEPPLPPSQFDRRLRGDLEWILLRCLAKEQGGRYAGVEELSEDLRRAMASEPVLAGPPSRLYRLRKFAVRSPGLLAAVSVALLSLAGTAVSATLGYMRVVHANGLAQDRQREAESQLQRRERAYEFMSRLFSLSQEAQDPDLTVREILGLARNKLEDCSDDPELQAELCQALGESYYNIGLQATGAELFEQAWKTWKGQLGEDHPRTLGAMKDFAISTGRLYELYGIERLNQDAQAAEHEGRLEDQLWSLQQIVVLHLGHGQAKEAIELCDRVLGGVLAGGELPAFRGRLQHNRAQAMGLLGQGVESLKYLEASEASLREAGRVDEADAVRAERGGALLSLGHPDEARPLIEEAYQRNLASVGPAALQTAKNAINLALLEFSSNSERARDLCQQILDNADEIGAESLIARTAQRRLALLLAQELSQPVRGAELLADLARREEANPALPKAQAGRTWALQGSALALAGNWEGAVNAYDRAAQLFADLAADNAERCRCVSDLALALVEVGDLARLRSLEPELRRSHELVAENQATRLRTATAIAAMLTIEERLDEARPFALEARDRTLERSEELPARLESDLARLGIPAAPTSAPPSER